MLTGIGSLLISILLLRKELI